MRAGEGAACVLLLWNETRESRRADSATAALRHEQPSCGPRLLAALACAQESDVHDR